MEDSPTPPALAPVVPLIKRGDLDHYRHLALHANTATLRAVVLLMADDLEDALDAIGPPITGQSWIDRA